MYLQKKGHVPKQAHVGIPEGQCEEEHGRRGFSGPSSHLYRTHPPTDWVRIDGPLRPRAFVCATLPTQDERSADARPVEILRSHDARVFLSRRAEATPYFVRNADGDEIYFVHRGSGRFETDYGQLPYEPGDYVVIPKGTTYRTIIESRPSLFLIVETPEPVEIPERGLLGQHALFDKGVLSSPELDGNPDDHAGTPGEWEVRIKRRGEYTSLVYPFYPMDVVGWKGDLWVAKLNVRDFRPVTSARYHLPPSVHATFQAGGVLISTFAPRPLERDPQALRIPFYHRNMDYDEVLFYHQGNFFSRAGIQPGMLTLHPQGIHHGPQPQAVEASKDKTETDEIAVMIESRDSLTVLPELESVEVKDYALSWSRR
ncbi:MAG: homogentisate 1,2-dioxygenase [Nitrospirota bacterium]|nr:homogentisate 1,2-dioxygenase [Nitrospirota bacterium]MDE3218783.1 homogentisate 1,2-dioxygenase [Nitrospirota bacterium]